MDKPGITMTAEQFEQMLTRVVAEARKPPEPSEQEKLQAEQAKEMRKERGLIELKKKADDRWTQEHCSHRHKNGNASIAHVQNGNFLICVQCQAKIKQFADPTDEGQYIYNQNLFIELLQAQSTATFS